MHSAREIELHANGINHVLGRTKGKQSAALLVHPKRTAGANYNPVGSSPVLSSTWPNQLRY